MRDWILGIQKAAIEHRAGVAAQEWQAAEHEAGYDAPEELRDLYQHLNGATFATGVVLHPLRGSGEVRGMFEQNRSGGAGLPTTEVWRFGRHDNEHLVAVRKRQLAGLPQISVDDGAEWLAAAPDDGWVFLARDEEQDRVRVYRSLEQMLTSRIPPAATEDFGDTTFARALSLVELALDEVEPTRRPAPPIPANVKRAAEGGRPRAVPAAKKASTPRAKPPAKKKGVAGKVKAAARKVTGKLKAGAKAMKPGPKAKAAKGRAGPSVKAKSKVKSKVKTAASSGRTRGSAAKKKASSTGRRPAGASAAKKRLAKKGASRTTRR